MDMKKIFFEMEKEAANLDSLAGKRVAIVISTPFDELEIDDFIQRCTEGSLFEKIEYSRGYFYFYFNSIQNLREMDFNKVNEMTRNLPYYNESSFKEGHVFDENQSVKWNREQVAIRNKEILEMKSASRKFNSLVCEMIEDVIKTEVFEYENLTQEAKDFLFYKAYEDGHSGGYYEVKNKLEEYLDLVTDFCEKQGLSF